MSNVANSVLDLAEDCLVRACWRQWKSLTGEGWAEDESIARSILDPEALVLASLFVRNREARLRDRLLWWASAGAHLMSVSRLGTMMSLFPEDLSTGVGWFAARTQDARWAKLALHVHAEESARTGKGPAELQLLEPATLMLRLRAGFGVSAKADLLAFLLGASALRGPGFHASASALSLAIQFSPSSVRRATTDMCLARMIEASRDRPPTFSVDASAWAHLLSSSDPYRPPSGGSNLWTSLDLPPWRFWGHVYPLLAACVSWGRVARASQTPPVVLASRARDITESFERASNWNGWPAIDGLTAPGERFLEVFEAFVQHVTRWVDENV